MIQYKPCKGQGQTTGFGCNKSIHVSTRKLGLCSSCYASWLFESDAGKVKLSKSLKANKPHKAPKKQHAHQYTRSALKIAHDALKKDMHEYVRLRDKGKPCISCLTTWRPDFQAGHYFKAELFETLRYHPHNLNGQCVECNILQDGNNEPYGINLPLRIGLKAYNELLNLAQKDKHFSKVWNTENLQQLREAVEKLKSEL